MPSPQITWLLADNLTPVTRWDIGTVDAGSTSPDKTFLIWNNRGGTTAISDATGCSLTTKDSQGNNTGELVSDKWIQVRVDTMSETSFTPIGGTFTKAVKAGGSAPAGVIKGSINDGTKTNAIDNFTQVTLHASPTATATAGNVDFLLRLAYQYS